MTKTEKTRTKTQSRPSGSQSVPGGLILPEQVLPPNLFVLPVSSAVIYPSLMAPLVISNQRFVATAEEAIQRQRVIGLLLSKEDTLSSRVRSQGLYPMGVAVKILKRLKLPDGSINLLVHSMKRFRVKRFLSEKPHIVAECEYLDDQIQPSKELDALTRTVISHVKKLAEVNPFFTEEMRLAMINAPGPGTVADLVAFALALPKKDAQDFLETLDVSKRFEKLLVHLKREQDVADLQKKIHDDVNSKINKMQREYFLKEQLKAIRKELGEEEDPREKTLSDFAKKIEASHMPKEALKVAKQELSRLESIPEQSPEYNVVRSYLESIVSLPWSEHTEDRLDLRRARRILNRDHYGLEDVKKRITEFLAVRKLKEEALQNQTKKKKKKVSQKTELDWPEEAELDSKGSIICLVGPPGVGKTSIGKSIAKTLGRKFYRFSLGGMRDEAEIKGHRRTYIGAMPGKVMQAVQRAGTKNPVLMLDEIDKLGVSFQGDPASALLEVLDPEQNHAFLDHYLDVPFDLSDVLFVATANTLSSIPEPLLDRMEVIELPGYTLEEKEKIATQYVIPKVFQKNGISPSQVKITSLALKSLMKDYAREPGMRTVQQLVHKIARKAAAKLVSGSSRKPTFVITEKNLADWLGPKRFYNEMAERITSPGIAVGLAWTSTGGDILFIEARDTPGSGRLKLTGKMGEVMNESANIAWSYIKRQYLKERHAGSFSKEALKETDIHLHIPAGAIPKDGPSAGVTMALTLYSLLTGRKVRQKLAMTGELSLVGKVLPVGGIKEKILAAKRAGIKTILLPKLNEKDLKEVPAYAKKDLKIQFVSHMDEVLTLALEPKKRKPSARKRAKKTKR